MREKVYKQFETLLESGRYSSFESVCRAMGLAPDDVDEFLMAELGYSGEQVFNYYFGNRCKTY